MLKQIFTKFWTLSFSTWLTEASTDNLKNIGSSGKTLLYFSNFIFCFLRKVSLLFLSFMINKIVTKTIYNLNKLRARFRYNILHVIVTWYSHVSIDVIKRENEISRVLMLNSAPELSVFVYYYGLHISIFWILNLNYVLNSRHLKEDVTCIKKNNTSINN